MKECINYKKNNDSTLKCEACNHFCLIQEGKVGVCGIRQNQNGKLYLLAYGKAVAAQIDPVEKKPLFHFLPGAKVFSFGTVGCNFRCLNCQNHDISQMFENKGNINDYDKIFWGRKLSPAEIVDAAIANNCVGIAYTYNEPTVWMEYALDTMKLAKEKSLKNIWVSNGYMSVQTREMIEPYLDAINIDIKSYDPDFYRRITGATLKPVLDNCRYFAKQSNVWLEITTLIIPTLSDQEEMLNGLVKFIKKELGADVPWHVSAFSGSISWRLQNLPDTQPESVNKVYEIGKKAGLDYVYTGNLWQNGQENTYCPKCGELIIERRGYDIIRYDRQGKCGVCNHNLAGIFL